MMTITVTETKRYRNVAMKNLCKLDYKKRENLLTAFALCQKPKFICEKCGRVASVESVLCASMKPKKLHKEAKGKKNKAADDTTALS